MGSGVSTQKLEGFPDPFFLITYLPPKTKGLVYSETHHVYANDQARAESLPLPRAPATRKREMFSPHDMDSVDVTTDELITTDLDRPINELVRDLIHCYDDDLSKVRALYRWLTSQPVMTSEYDKSNQTIAMHQLWNLQQGRISYAFFFSILCWLAEIPCVIVRGLIKGSTYVVGQQMSHDSHVGEWNAVLIGEHWRLVDTFWGSSTIPDNEEYSQDAGFYDTSESYFLTDPAQFIYSHFPDEEAWQLLGDDTKSLQQFEAMAVLNDRFFTFEMELMSHFESTIETDDGNVSIHFRLHPKKSENQAFICIPSAMSETSTRHVDHDAQSANDNVRITVDSEGDTKVLIVNVQLVNPGAYRLDIVGRDLTNSSQTILCDWVAAYNVIFNRKTGTDSATTIHDEPVEPTFHFKPCTELVELGLVSIDHQQNAVEMSPGDLTLQYAIIDPGKIAGVTIHAHVLTMNQVGDPNIENGLLEYRINGNVFVKDGDALKAVIKVEVGHFEIRILYRTIDGQEYLICKHEIICEAPVPKLDPACIEQYNTKLPHIVTHQPRGSAEIEPTQETHSKSDTKVSPEVISKPIAKKSNNKLTLANKSPAPIKKMKPVHTVTKGPRPSTKLSNHTSTSNGTVATAVCAPMKKSNVRKYVAKTPHRLVNKTNHKAIEIPTSTTVENSTERNSEGKAVNRITTQNDQKSTAVVHKKKDRSLLNDGYSEFTTTTRSDIQEAQSEDPEDLRRRLVAATKNQHVGQLFRAIRDTLASGHVTTLSAEVTVARELLMRLRRLQEVLKQVMALSHRALSEIRSYAHPIPAIYRVMQATLLLLGHTEEETKDWSDVRNIIGRTGKLSLMRRIKDLQTQEIDGRAAERSRHLLRGLNKEDLGQYSVGVAIFYTWAVEVSNDEQYRHQQ